MDLIYGIVLDGTFYSNRMERRVPSTTCNGIYHIDMDDDDFWRTIQTADVYDAIQFFRKASTIQVIRGVSFHNGIVPDNPVIYPQLPIAVRDGQFEEFEPVEVAVITRRSICVYLRTVPGHDEYTLLDLKECFEKERDINTVKNITPAMCIMFGFHLLEKRRKQELEPINVIKSSMTSVGAEVISVKPCRAGFEVRWQMADHKISTLLDKNYRVIEAGFCVSGYDKTQSVKSVANLLKDYVDDDDVVHITRSVD